MVYESTYLAHHGVMGMKWGVRRYRNEDGTLTERGKKHYAKKGTSEDQIRQDYLKSKKLRQLSTREIQEMNNRQQAINQHQQLNPGLGKKILKGLATGTAVAGAVTIFATKVNTLRDKNGQTAKLVRDGKAAAKRAWDNRELAGAYIHAAGEMLRGK